MEPKKTTLKTERPNKNAWMKVALISLIVVGGAISAGSALGNREGTDNGSNSSANAKAHDGDNNGTGGGNSSGGSGNSTGGSGGANQPKISYTLTASNATVVQNVTIDIMSFSFGIENPTTVGSATGGAGTGKIKFNEFTIKKTVDKASPAFFKAAATGDHFKQVVLTIRSTTGNNTTTLMSYTFGTAFVTNIDISGSGDIPMESITFVYGTLELKYTAQDTGDTSQFAWDQIENKAA